LQASDLARLEPHLEPVDLPLRQRVATPYQPITHVYFPDSGMVSVVLGLPHEIPIEIGLVGKEGMVNLPVVLGEETSPTDVFVQIAGSGRRIAAAHLRAAMAESTAMRNLFLRCCNAFIMQVASTVLANGRATLPERLARWLLMASDRLDSPVLPLTHEFLSIMLGVRRSGVTLALRDFEKQELVSRKRALITILDREDLVNVANGYYGMAEKELERVFERDLG
jgi:CRP-like cAMP-binding protein